MPSSDPPQPDIRPRTVLGLRPLAWLIVAIAFVAGFALFALIWSQQRADEDFYRADGARKSVSGREFEALPRPDPEAAEKARPKPPEDAPDARVIETRPPPASSAPAPQPVRPVEQPAIAPGVDTPPVPVSSPPPRYPRAALRRGESGEVLLRVQVGPDGAATAIELVRSSGSRALDRAATDAVRQWRFRPARRAGRPVAGVVQVPIAFNPGP